jgi:acyl dehydratase
MTPADFKVGEKLITAEFGPFTIVDAVRWAGVQENIERVHFDREFVRENSRLNSFIASGGYRQALLCKALTDRIGPSGRLLRLRVRHTAPTVEGDMLRYSARITETGAHADGFTITCEIEGKNQRDEQVLVGSCVVHVAAYQNAD